MMKRIGKSILMLCLRLIFFGTGFGAREAWAAEQLASGTIEANNIQWTLWNDGKLEFSVLSHTGEGSIPNMSSDATSEWLAYKSQIKTVTILQYSNTNITSIGDYAFSGCDNLTAVEIPDGTVTGIGSNIFYGCTKLTSLTLPPDLTSVNRNAFNGMADGFKLCVASSTSSTAKALSSAG